MRAVRWHGPRDVRVEDVPVPEPGPGEVLIEVAYCGICGSDLHEYADGPHAIPVRAPHPVSGDTAPITIGHELAGTVVSGDGFTAGDTVWVEPNYRCGRCARCVAGDDNLCRDFGILGMMGNGGMASHAVIPGYMVHAVPAGIPMEQVAVFEPAGVALHAIHRSQIRDGETVAVVGLGPIGLLIVQLLAARGCEPVIGVDPSPGRRELAAALGATRTVPDAAELRDVDVAFEVVGSGGVLRRCLAATRNGGRVVMLGLTGEVTLDAFAFVNSEQTIITSLSSRDVHDELVSLVADGGVDLTAIVTATVPLERVVKDAFEPLLADPGSQVKVLIQP